MNAVQLLLGEPDASRYLEAHDLVEGYCEIEAILLQAHGTEEGRPCVLLAVVLDDGTRVVAKTTYRLLQMALAGVHGTLQRRGGDPVPSCSTVGVVPAVYPCGCAHARVELGQCGVYNADGTVRQPRPA